MSELFPGAEEHLRQGRTCSYLSKIGDELGRAIRKFPRPIKSLHEGHSIIREEFEEFWDEVKPQNDKRDAKKIEAELIQTAAMCLRVLVELAHHNFEDQ